MTSVSSLKGWGRCTHTSCGISEEGNLTTLPLSSTYLASLTSCLYAALMTNLFWHQPLHSVKHQCLSTRLRAKQACIYRFLFPMIVRRCGAPPAFPLYGSTLGLNYPGLRNHQGVELHLSCQWCISGKDSYANSEVLKPRLRGLSVQLFFRITFRSNGHPAVPCYCNALHYRFFFGL